MMRRVEVLAFGMTLLLSPPRARGLDRDAQADEQAPPGAKTATPSTEPPAQTPPSPPSPTPPPPKQSEQAPDAQVPPGQWVYTQQYGWIWMPYSADFTYAPTDAYGSPYMYVYYPAYGWAWVVAPWVWGWGPWPYFDFGPFGASAFAWFNFGWWRTPSRFRFRTAPFRGISPRRGVVIAPGPRAVVRQGAVSPRGRATPRQGSAGAPAPSGGAPSGGGARGGGGGGGGRGGAVSPRR